MQTNDADLGRHFATRPCSHCQQPMMADSVLVVARRSRTWVVMATCGRCHHRGLYVVSLPKLAKAPVAAYQRSPVSYDDVHDMRSFLDTFDGNFHALFDFGSGGHLAAE